MAGEGRYPPGDYLPVNQNPYGGQNPHGGNGYGAPFNGTLISGGGISGDSGSEREPSISDLIKLLRKYRRLVTITVIVFAIASLVYCIFATKMYTASSAIEIGGYDPLLPGAQMESLFGQDTRKQDYQKTTIAKLKRLGIADKVLARDNLAADLEVYFARHRGLMSRVRDFFSISGWFKSDVETNVEEDLHYVFSDTLLKKYLGLISVHPIHETSLVELSVTSADRQLSQRIANVHSEVFIDHLRKQRQKNILANLKLLQIQSDELQEKVAAAERNLARYAESNELVSLSKDENMVIKQIADLTGLLVAATEKRIRSESLLREVESQDSMLSTALDDAPIRQLRVTLKQAQAEYADMSQKFMPSYPTMLQLKAKINSLKQTIHEERLQALGGLRTRYESDLQAEEKLIEQIEAQKTNAHEVSKKLVQYNILSREYESTQDLYQTVLRQLKESRISSASSSSNIYISDYAALPRIPSAPLRSVILVLGTFCGFIAGVALALLLEVLDSTIKTSEDAQAVLGLPSLGIVPSFAIDAGTFKKAKKEQAKTNGQKKSVPDFMPTPADTHQINGTNGSNGNNGTNGVNGDNEVMEVTPTIQASGEKIEDGFLTVSFPQAVVSEAFRTIRAGILLSSADSPPKVVMVTSSRKGEGKTTLVSNLAVTLAQASHSTVLIDADVRQSKINSRFDVPYSRAGLVDYLAGQAHVGEIVSETSVNNLDVITAGSLAPNPAELIGSQKMAELIKLLSMKYDYILLDTPPVLPVADALMLSRVVDGVVMVVRSHKTEKGLAQEATRRLNRVSAPVLGVVVNDVNLSKPGAYNYKDASSAARYVVSDQIDERRNAVGF